MNLLFRADLYNALNHAQWRYLDTTFSAGEGSTFGRVTEARERADRAAQPQADVLSCRSALWLPVT